MGLAVLKAALVVATMMQPGKGMPKPPSSDNWCRVGQLVMIPDGREGPVTSVEGDICRVLAYGEKYVGLWMYDMIEPVGPLPEPRRYHHGP